MGSVRALACQARPLPEMDLCDRFEARDADPGKFSFKTPPIKCNPVAMENFSPLDGALLIDKPAGPTSHDVVDAVRRHFGIKKVGHCGTLDPNATGLLIIVLGRGTKLSERLMGDDKVYEGTIKFGESTDSYDCDGEITGSLPVMPMTLEELNAEAAKFIGDQMQMPPMVSAIKKNGVPLYKLARKDVDAVIIATPDHLHARIAAEAMEAGKDVYVQKPMVKQWQDGHRLIETSQRTRRILQVGSQRVSSVIYKKAQELYRAGSIGTLNAVEAWIDRNSAIGAWRYSIPPDASPATIDWDRFLGDAPKRPFDPQRMFQWRNWNDYGTGVAGDLFVHLFSGIHFVLGSLGPTRVFAAGGIYFWKGDRDVPDIMVGLYDYPHTDNHPAFNLALRVNFVCGGPETGRC